MEQAWEEPGEFRVAGAGSGMPPPAQTTLPSHTVADAHEPVPELTTRDQWIN